MAELSLITKATVVLLAALAATSVARGARASVRALILATAFVLVLSLPFAGLVVPARTVEIPTAYSPVFWIDETSLARAGGPVAAPSSQPPIERQWRRPSPVTIARAVWALGAVVFATPLLVGLWRLRGLRRRGRPWLEGRQLAATLSHSTEVRLKPDTTKPGLKPDTTKADTTRPRLDVVLIDDLLAPMTYGWRRPTIAMPADAIAWPAADVRHALLHELEHIRRRDWPVQILARLTCALYWFNPVAWIAWGRLRLESERACDDAVVAHAENTAYAQQLVSLARRFSNGTSVPLLSMADRRTLAARVAGILSSTVARGRVGVRSAAAIIAGAVALSVAISPLQARPLTQRPDGAAPSATPAGFQFEAASVRARKDPGGGFMGVRPGGRFTAEGVSLQDLIVFSYRVQPYQIVDGPAWLDVSRWDVNATGATGTRDDVLLALQRLLADRFSLAIRRETREMPIYALVVARSNGRLGPQLKPSPVDCAALRAEAQKTGVIPQDAPRLCVAEGRLGSIRIGGAPLAEFVPMLSTRVQRIVVDRTGLKGPWDLTLTYAPDPAQIPPGPLFPGVSFDPNGPSLFTAVQEQLGLRLESQRAPVEVLVVERVASPTPNDAPEPPPAAQPQAAVTSSPAQSPAFDVESVRRNTSGGRGGRQQFTDGRFAATNTSVRLLILDAYRLQSFQVAGGPEWLDTARFDIVATIPANTAPAQRPAMLQRLLADRFKLETHIERREMPMYALVVDRNDRRLGPDLRRSTMDCSAVADGGPQRAPVTTVRPDGRPECGMTMGPAAIRGGGMTMTQLANALAGYVRRTVVDRTGLEGFYDFDLRYAPSGPRTPSEVNTADLRPSIFTAVQEQLGLKLEAQQGPVDVLVIDRVEQPEDN